MALTTSRSISLSGQSIINGITVETYNASVSETNPESMYINQSTVNHEMRKANRAQPSVAKTETNLRNLLTVSRMK